MKRLISVAVGSTALWFALACGASSPTPAPAPAPPAPAPVTATPEARAAAVAEAFAKEPGMLDEILKEHGFSSADEVESLLYEIAADAARTRAYLDARAN